MNLISASKIWTTYSDESMRYVRVKNNVANISNRQVLLRSVLPFPAEDGLYNIGMRGELIRANPDMGVITKYPDIDLLAHFFKDLKVRCSLDQNTRMSMLECIRLMSSREHAISISSNQMSPRWAYSEGEGNYLYPFNIEPAVSVNSKYLDVVFTAFADYPVLHVGKVEGEKNPLIIGVDWGNCALISPF